jgi:hypothetical protein
MNLEVDPEILAGSTSRIKTHLFGAGGGAIISLIFCNEPLSPLDNQEG